QLASAAQRVAVDAGDHRFAQVLDEVEHRLTLVGVSLGLNRIVLVQLANVRAGDKSFFARAGEQRHANFRIVFDGSKRLAQLSHHCHVECVKFFWAVDDDGGDLVVLVELEVLKVHSKKPYRG